MKRDTPSHPKLVRLAKELAVRRYVAVGILQSLWDWAGRFCPDGDVGRHGLDVLAEGIDYDGNADALVSALIETGWLDRLTDGRVIIHDWAQHCEDNTHNYLARRRSCFADGSIPKLTRLPVREREGIEAFYREHTCSTRVESALSTCEKRYTITSTITNTESVKSRGDFDATSQDDSKEEIPEADAPEAIDPLADLDRLAGAYSKINKAIVAAHPRAKLPRPGTKADTEARDTLARLVRLDHYSEADVIAVFKWCLKSDDSDAVFWRAQVHALPPLRKRKDGLSKFDRISEAYQRAHGGANGDRVTSNTLKAVIAAHGARGVAQ